MILFLFYRPIGSYRFNVTGLATARPDAPNQLDVNFDNGKFNFNVI